MIFEDFQSLRTTGKTLIGFNETQGEHRNTVCTTHPESSKRVEQIKKGLHESGILGLEQCEVVTEFVEIDDGDLEYTHAKEMLKKMNETENMSQMEIDTMCKDYDSVFMTENSIKVAKDGVACVRELTDRIMHNEALNGFAVIRPPGHHADKASPCGFCLFNNVAQAAEEAFFAGAERVLVVDLDVHHGQGTQRIFYEEKRVLYFSIHRYEHGLYWPHLKESDFDHIGEGQGLGYNANVPLNETGCTDSDYLSILFQFLLPLANQFDPHFVIVSAGFDSLIGDPLGGMELTPDGYSHIIYHLKSLAQGRMLVVLEGGYNHQMSACAAQKVAKVLMGYAPDPIKLKEAPKESTVTSCVSLVSLLRHHWNCFDYFPSKSSMRLVQWPVSSINTTVEFKYDPLTRTPDTGEINQKDLMSEAIQPTSDFSPLETFIYYNEQDEQHFHLTEDEDHPERPARTRAILKSLRASQKVQKCVQVKSERSATDEEIKLAHTKGMLTQLKKTEEMSQDELIDMSEDDFNSVYFTKDTIKVARNALGTVLQAIDDLYKKPAGQRNGFVCVRPPGHHASSTKSCGFCIFNNVAVAAKYAQKKYRAKRVLIFDWDVHHGNGTQDIFYEDKSVMYMSIHKHERGNFFPVGENKDFFDCGEGFGLGTSVNVPFSGGKMGDLEYQMAFQRVILPIAYQFNPDLVLISAGFDAAADDLLGNYTVSPETFALMAYQLSSLAGGRVLAVLEGGYNLQSISSCAIAVVEVLQDRAMIRRLKEEKEQFASEQKKMVASSIKTVRECCAKQQQFWSILKGFQVLPADCGLNDDSIVPMESDEQPTSSSTSAASEDPMEEEDEENEDAEETLTSCPHLSQVTKLPIEGIDAAVECSKCPMKSEVWTCLTCFESNCGRFVHGHSSDHQSSTGHPLAISLADFSVWCHQCQSFVHNELLAAAISSAHESKFGVKGN